MKDFTDIILTWFQKYPKPIPKSYNLPIQGRMQIFEKYNQKALNHVLTLES